MFRTSLRKTASSSFTSRHIPFLTRAPHHAPFASTRKQPPPEPPEPPKTLPTEQFQPSPALTLVIAKRVFKYTAFSLLGLGATATSTYWLFQFYSEYAGLAPETDPDIIEWEWNIVDNQWSPSPTHGGTDPSLSRETRRLIRAAWQAYTYGVGGTIVTSLQGPPSNDTHSTDPTSDIHALDARLQKTEILLRNAIKSAEKDGQNRELSPNTIPTLRLRHAIVLEQLGDAYLTLSEQEYQLAWRCFQDKGPFRAYIALKLGDVYRRLGQDADAILWWNKSVQLTQPTHNPSIDVNNLSTPLSPSLQRIFFSNLISQSAFLAAAGKFKEANAIEEKGLALLRSIPAPQSIESTPPGHALHALYLLQRSSLLTVHLAETLYAIKCSPLPSMQWLTSAAESSERVALLLTGTSPASSGQPIRDAPKSPLLPIYINSRSMSQPAQHLLHDAQRTAAEAWNLLGILVEGSGGPSSRRALECYERAIYWAGIPTPDGQGMEANDAVPESDWHIYWNNYQRLGTSQKSSE